MKPEPSLNPNPPILRWLDLVRVLGAFLVVTTHTKYNGQIIGISNAFYYGLTRVAVPLFFMASGYLLLSKNEPLTDFLRKRASKMVIPFLAWSVIYLIWKEEGFGKPFLSAAYAYVLRIANRPSEQHMWFLYELFGLYLFTPILRLYLQNAKVQDLLYFLVSWFILIPVVFFLREFTPLDLGFSYPFLGGYIGYFLFGYFAGHFLNESYKKYAWVGFFLGLAVTVAGLRYREIHQIKSQYYEEYLSAFVVIMAWSLFVLHKDIQVSDRIHRLLTPLNRASFGIYLIHMIVITELFAIEPFATIAKSGNGIYMPPILGAMGFAVSFVIVFLLQKIPYVRSIVPS